MRRNSVGLAEGARYLIVGCLNTAVGYGVFGAAVWLGSPHQTALLLNYLIGSVHSYLWNRFWTFRATGSHRRQLSRFLLVNGAMYGTNALLLEGFVRAGLAPLLAQLACLVITTVLGYAGHRLWSFRPERVASPQNEQA